MPSHRDGGWRPPNQRLKKCPRCKCKLTGGVAVCADCVALLPIVRVRGAGTCRIGLREVARNNSNVRLTLNGERIWLESTSRVHTTPCQFCADGEKEKPPPKAGLVQQTFF